MIRKRFVEEGGTLVCRVTFMLPSSLWAGSVHLVADFNGWSHTSHPLQPLRDGTWAITVDLEVGQLYQFRYLCDGRDWVNDSHADAYTPNPYGSDNSVVNTDPSFESRPPYEQEARPLSGTAAPPFPLLTGEESPSPSIGTASE